MDWKDYKSFLETSNNNKEKHQKEEHVPKQKMN